MAKKSPYNPPVPNDSIFRPQMALLDNRSVRNTGRSELQTRWELCVQQKPFVEVSPSY